MKYAVILFTVTCFLLAQSSHAQFQGDVYRQYNDAKVKVGTNNIELPWTGGVNTPQLAMADLNLDGKEDIVLYENSLGIKTLIATTNGHYTYDSRYEAFFPSNVNGYVKLIDFNRDGIKDLVHRSSAGVGVYYGYYDIDTLKFKYYKDLYYNNGTGPVSVYIPPGYIPALADVDYDGDIDIIAYESTGTLIGWYKNCQKEDGLPDDSIKICYADECWGRISQGYWREQLLGQGCYQGNTTCKGCPLAKGTHGLNSLLLIDMDDDGDWDWFNSNESFSEIQFFYNGKAQFGGVDSAIAQDTMWSASGVKVYQPLYPGAFYVNVDHDKANDLIFTTLLDNTENYNSISFYKNVGTNTSKNFVFQKNTYLVDRMIDMGRCSYPCLYDMDKDGKKDLLLGSEGFYQPSTARNKSKLAYYRNTSPGEKSYSFNLESDDFLSLGAMNMEGASIAVGDLDNDTLDDLVIGHTDGTFTFFKNYASSNNTFPDWRLEQMQIQDAMALMPMDVGDYATPFIYDIDGDGKNDLISGNQNGDLYYYQNIGTKAGSISMKKVTQNLGGVKLIKDTEPYAFSVPYIGKMDDTEKDYLVIGCQWGRLYRYDGFQNGAMPGTYTMLDSQYSFLHAGRRSAPAFADLDKDPKHLYELVMGNELGGLNFYKQDFKVGIDVKIAEKSEVSVYPNPAKDMLIINWDKGFNKGGVSVKFISITGQEVGTALFDEHKASGRMSLSNYPPGLYYCIVQSGAQKNVQPVTILR